MKRVYTLTVVLDSEQRPASTLPTNEGFEIQVRKGLVLRASDIGLTYQVLSVTVDGHTEVP